MKTLILYLSHDGQTKKIAQFITALLQEKGEDVQLQSLTESNISLDSYDRIVIGAAIRYGYFSKLLYRFIEQNMDILNNKKTAFFGVNLTARKEGKNTPETNAYVRKFLTKIDWKPTQAAVFAGALRYPEYRFFDRICIQLIMKITGGETDPTVSIEYTDWQKVEIFAEQILSL